MAVEGKAQSPSSAHPWLAKESLWKITHVVGLHKGFFTHNLLAALAWAVTEHDWW